MNNSEYHGILPALHLNIECSCKGTTHQFSLRMRMKRVLPVTDLKEQTVHLSGFNLVNYSKKIFQLIG